jgi:hypothetical protein
MATLEDVQAMAYNVVALPSLKKQKVVPEAAIYRYWLANKDVGTPATAEIPLDDGSRAVVTSSGRVLHWTGGDTVEVL